MEDRAKYTTYLAGAIEHVDSKEMTSWRDQITQLINNPNLLIYDPIIQESSKVGKPSGEQVNYIKGLKRAGHLDKFYEEMWKIWFGNISINTDIIPLLTNLKMRKHIDGNKKNEINSWGDAEAVVRSDFIIVYMPKAIKTVGTIFEVVFAFIFRIPIYLILPDDVKTEANSSLIFGVQISKGNIFYNINSCANFINKNYNLNKKGV